MYLGGLANRAACPFGRPRRLRARGTPPIAPAPCACPHRSPRSTARQTRLSSPLPQAKTNHVRPLCAACSSNAAGVPLSSLPPCARARDERRPGPPRSATKLAATSSFLPRKKREKFTSEQPRLANAKAGRTRRGTVVPVAIGGPIGHQFRSAHARAVGGGRSTRSASRSCDSGQRQVRPKYQIPEVVAFPALSDSLTVVALAAHSDWIGRRGPNAEVRNGCRSSNLVGLTPQPAAMT
jgi:hypothetical protein